MDLITKDDLQLWKYDYSWKVSPGDNPNITGKPDSGRVSRAEGYEVLDYINAFAKKYNLTSKADGRKIEDMLHHSKEVMRDKLTLWIATTWGAWKG